MANITVIGNGAPVTLDVAKVTSAFWRGQAEEKAKVKEALEAAGYTEERVTAALQAVALRRGGKHAWSVVGQAVGLGSPTKAKSGASGARSLYNAAIGKAGARGSVATDHAPAVARAGTKQQQGAAKQQAKAS